MKKNNFISYIIGTIFLLLVVLEFIKLLMVLNVSNFQNYITSIICYIGAIVFILSRILGIMPVSKEKKELYKRLINELRKSDFREFKKYTIPDELYERLKKNNKDLDTLNLIAKDILGFCNIDNLNIKVYIQKDLMQAAGTYYKGTINISDINTRTTSEVIAVLIHECMHHILFSKNIRINNTLENELLTDIACLYYGFGDYINSGYIRVGYLKRNDIRYIKKLLNN